MTTPTRARRWLPTVAVAVVILLVVWLAASLLVRSVAAPPAGVPPDVTTGLAPRGPTEIATVVRVVDGDTAIVQVDGGRQRVRYIGIDSPELADADPAVRALAEGAANEQARLVEGREVELERDVSDTDRFGRLLRYVWVDDGAGGLLLVNLELVARGSARARSYPPDVAWQDVMSEAQDAARAAGLGLWAAGE